MNKSALLRTSKASFSERFSVWTFRKRIINYCFLSESESSKSSSDSSSNSSSKSVSSTEFLGASSLLEGISRDLQATWPELLGICAIALGG